MAEFKEVMKQFKRMCDGQKWCDNCQISDTRGIYACSRWLTEHPTKAEGIIMTWAEEHPLITNHDKFKEVFGLDFKTTFNASPWTLEWLDEEYKEPKDE